MAYLLLGLAQACGLLLTGAGGPGAWIQLAALAIFAWVLDFQPFGTIPLLVLLTMTVCAELLDPLLGGPLGERGATRSLSSSAMLGGIAGALVTEVLPLAASLAGALLGAAIASLLALLTLRPARGERVRGVARAAAATIRTTTGIAIAAIALLGLRS